MLKTIVYLIPGALFLVYWFAAAPGQEVLSITGIVFEVKDGRMVLLPDKEGKPDERRGDAMTFTVDSSTKVNGKPELGNALRPQLHATVKYHPGKAGALAAREVTLLDNPWDAPRETNQAEAPKGDTPTKGEIKLKEVRIQQTDREGDPAIEAVQQGAAFYVAFYVDVVAHAPYRLRYRCAMPDLDGIDERGGVKGDDRDYRFLEACDFEETVPAGFRGTRYRAFRVTADHRPWKTAMLGRVSLVLNGANGAETEVRQQRPTGLEIR